MENKKFKELTEFEKMVSNPQVLGDYLVMGTAFIESVEPIDKNLVKKSLEIMQQRHPFYRAYLEVHKKENRMFLKINDDDSELANKIKLEWLDLTNETFSRRKVIDESARFDSEIFQYGKENLLWKTQVISYIEDSKVKYVLNLVNHIVITDGLNTNTLVIEIVNILNALLTQQECDEMKVKLEPVDNLHVLCKERNLYKDEHQETIKKLNNIELPKFVLHEKFKSNKESGFKLDLFKLDKELTAKILSKAKLNKVRLTGFFQNAAIYAMKSLYDENGLEFPRKILIEIAASLRVRYQPVLNFSNCGLHTVMVIFPTDENLFGDFNDFWKDARYVHGLIQENTNSETGHLFSLSHSDQLKDFNQIFSDANSLEEVCSVLSKEVSCDLAVSNLGTFVNDHVQLFPGPLSIKELYCTDPLNSNPSISPAIVFHKFFWKGEIMIELGANKSSINSSYIDRYKEIYLKVINDNLL